MSTADRTASPRDLAREIGARVQAARRDAGISQHEVAQLLGISQAAVSGIESGTRPLRVEEMARLAPFLGRELDYFLAPARPERETVGVTLRATAAELALPDVSRAVNTFLDEIEGEPLPEPKLTIDATRPEAAAQQARERTGEAGPPIDVNAIARKLGVGVFRWPFPDALSALVVRHDQHAVIGVNSWQAPTRQRFSTAHELGHVVLPHKAQHFIEYGVLATSDGEPPGYNWKHEREANEFAAELLMPVARLEREAEHYSPPRLARRYQVSEEAMGFRLRRLGVR